MSAVLTRMDSFVKGVETLEYEKKAQAQQRDNLTTSLRELQSKSKKCYEDLDIATHAIEILQGVSDEAVEKSYRFLEENLNVALSRMFTNSVRSIKLVEYTRANMYPQLTFQLVTENGIERSLKADSGHGIAQIVSLLSILSLIVITGKRRLLILDEVISGLSLSNLEVVTEILWTFVEIGFQFIINEHMYKPKGALVLELEAKGGVSKIVNSFVAADNIFGETEKKNKGLYASKPDELTDSEKAERLYEKSLIEQDNNEQQQLIETTTPVNEPQTVVNETQTVLSL